MGTFDEVRIKAASGSQVKVAGGTDKHLPDGPGYTMNRFYLTDLIQPRKKHKEVRTEPARVSVYPNPTSGSLHISGMTARKAEVFDLGGRLLRTFEFGKQQEVPVADLSGLARGVYLLKVMGEDEVRVFRVVKE